MASDNSKIHADASGNSKEKRLTLSLAFIDDDKSMDEVIDEVNSPILNKYKTINGRDFFDIEDLTYTLPSDKLEADRGTLSHILNKHAWKGNFRSPIVEKLKNGGAKVLDIGCGSGNWIIDMALEYPSSTFIGIDVNSSFFPSNDKCPSNVCFLTSNVIYGIPFPMETFDFVYLGMMFSAFTDSQWSKLIKDIIRVLKYEGWIESLEGTGILINCGKVTNCIGEAVRKACIKEKGINFLISTLMPKMFESNKELTNIQCIKVEYPIGEWFGYFGKCSVINIRRFFQSFVFVPEYLGVTYEEYIDLLDIFVKEANENKTYTYSQSQSDNYNSNSPNQSNQNNNSEQNRNSIYEEIDFSKETDNEGYERVILSLLLKINSRSPEILDIFSELLYNPVQLLHNLLLLKEIYIIQ
ncbi:6035_t:CDS:2 [Cetraspora pellucida]|uniref:6035_t:CDS:1 n=1 Tax=Cetraspora pellucida TaxID=1433469 RepID=A0A9N9C8S4_9GLOM|nr:6035_t:CDS:2 [Cetraspora pellucida]